jgi:hypothetical protein
MRPAQPALIRDRLHAPPSGRQVGRGDKRCLSYDTKYGIINLVARADKILAQMSANPRGDWRIEDIETVCKRYGLVCLAPRRGDHYKVAHPNHREIVTVPAQRPIRPVYIRQFVTLVRKVIGEV